MSEPAVGIDLGTSNTVIAVVQDNTAHVIPDETGNRIHPSIVSFHPKGLVLVGKEASRRRVIDPQNTITSAKRLIGRTFRSEAVQSACRLVSYTISEGENQQPVISSRGLEYTVPEISAFVLRHVKNLAESYLGQAIRQAVITVPANFNDAQREATKAAGQIAGLEVMRILNEPTAAALAYGYGQSMCSTVAIYDFGGGTFDITILQLNDRVFEVLSTSGDAFLGGDDFDELLVRHMSQLFLRETRLDLQDNITAVSRLRAVAEQVKRQLSSRPKTMVQVKEIAYGDGGSPLDLSFALTRDDFNAMALHLVRRSFLICDDALGLAHLATSQLDDVVLVGGTTRMPLVRQAVRDYFSNEPQTNINPDEVVAVGAAIQAASLLLAPHTGGSGAVLLDVTPRAIGIAVVGGFTESVIERNAQIPVEQTRVFTTSKDGQSQVRLQICQGESRIFEENQPLGELVLDHLRSAPRGEVKVEVTFEVNTNGILKVRARDAETGQEQKARIQVLGTVSAEKMEDLVRKQADMPAPLDQKMD